MTSVEKPWFKFYDEGVPYSIEYPEIGLRTFLEDASHRLPEKPAIYFFGLSITYSELNQLADRLASALESIGVSKGDPILINLPNLPQYVIAYYAVHKLGGVVVQSSPLYTAHEIEYLVKDSGAKTAITLDILYDRLKALMGVELESVILTKIQDFLPKPLNILYPLIQRLKGEKAKIQEEKGIHFMKKVLRSTPEHVIPEIKPDDLAVLQYTGGTTGKPKGAMLSQKNLVANTIQTASWINDLTEKDVFLSAIPFFHVYGMTTSLNVPVYKGSSMILLPDPRDINRIISSIHKYRVTIFCGVPTMYNAIIHHPKVKKFDITSVKACISGSAPLPFEVKREFENLTGGKLVEGYGLTETSPVTHCNPIYGLVKPCIGIPFPDTDAAIMDEEGNLLPVGEEGELVVKGPQVMLGYWNMDEETEEVFEGEWLRTGDIAKMDEDGYFYIVDRKKDIIICSGYNVYPREVEEVLHEHPAVLEAAVFGIPDEYRGESVKACVVLKEPADPEEIREFCKKNLAPYKVPREIEIREELPKSHVGKVLRRVLKEEAGK